MGRFSGNILSPKEDMSRTLFDKPGDTVDHRGLAGTVWSDDPQYFTCVDIETHITQSLDSPEMLGDPTDFENRFFAQNFIHLSN